MRTFLLALQLVLVAFESVRPRNLLVRHDQPRGSSQCGEWGVRRAVIVSRALRRGRRFRVLRDVPVRILERVRL